MLIPSGLSHSVSTQEALGPVVLGRVVELLQRGTLRSWTRTTTDTGKLRLLSRELIRNTDHMPSPWSLKQKLQFRHLMEARAYASEDGKSGMVQSRSITNESRWQAYHGCWGDSRGEVDSQQQIFYRKIAYS